MALPVPVSVYSILCVQTVVWLPVFGIFSERTDVDACDCSQGQYGLHTIRVQWNLTLGEKSLAALGTWAWVSIAPGFSVKCSTNQPLFTVLSTITTVRVLKNELHWREVLTEISWGTFWWYKWKRYVASASWAWVHVFFSLIVLFHLLNKTSRVVMLSELSCVPSFLGIGTPSFPQLGRNCLWIFRLQHLWGFCLYFCTYSQLFLMTQVGAWALPYLALVG